MGLLSSLADHFETRPPKGEIVILVDPPHADAAAPSDIDDLLREALAVQSVREAAALVAEATGAPRREVYARALAIKSGG